MIFANTCKFHLLHLKQYSFPLVRSRRTLHYTEVTSKPTAMQKLVQSSPESIRPYLSLLRLDRPIGTWLLFWPCAWSLTLGSVTQLPDPKLIALFGLGSVLLRGAGCVINDLWDRDLDKQVERTKDRPLASGRLSSKQALVFLCSQLLGGLVILFQFSSWFAIGLG